MKPRTLFLFFASFHAILVGIMVKVACAARPLSSRKSVMFAAWVVGNVYFGFKDLERAKRLWDVQ